MVTRIPGSRHVWSNVHQTGVLDPSDEALAFVFQRENIKPISMFKLQDGEFLLCYNREYSSVLELI